MKIACKAKCEAWQKSTPLFNVPANVTIYSDMSLFNESMDGVDLEEVSCAYCGGEVEEVEE